MKITEHIDRSLVMGVNREIAESAHQVVLDYCRKTRTPQHVLASRIGVPIGTLSPYLMGHQTMPAAVVALLTYETSDGRILETMRECAALDVSAAGDIDGLRAANLRAEQEFHEATHGTNEALADGVLTRDEYERQKRECAEAIEAARRAAEALDAAWKSQRIREWRPERLADAEGM